MKHIVLIIVLVLFAIPVFADTYIWEDAQGTVNFADDLGKVPKQYRKKAKIFGEEEPPPPENSEGKEAPPERGEAHRSSGEGASANDALRGKDKAGTPIQSGAGSSTAPMPNGTEHK